MKNLFIVFLLSFSAIVGHAGDLSPLDLSKMPKEFPGPGYTGKFESHLTYEIHGADEIERFKSAVKEVQAKMGIKLRAVFIELPTGEYVSQPMTTGYHVGSSAFVYDQVMEIATLLEATNFPLTRFKIEAMIGTTGVPLTDEASLAMPKGNYFEYHFKVLVKNENDHVLLKEIAKRNHSHLSRNVFETLTDGSRHFFVTLRSYKGGRQASLVLAKKLNRDITSSGLAIKGGAAEYSIIDTNTGLDRGWIPMNDEDAIPSLDESLNKQQLQTCRSQLTDKL
jgi:hypothetical protein